MSVWWCMIEKLAIAEENDKFFPKKPISHKIFKKNVDDVLFSCFVITAWSIDCTTAVVGFL